MENELTKGPVMQTMLRFAVPMILGDLLQQCYNPSLPLYKKRIFQKHRIYQCFWKIPSK